MEHLQHTHQSPQTDPWQQDQGNNVKKAPPFQLLVDGESETAPLEAEQTDLETASPETHLSDLQVDDPAFVDQLVHLADYRFLSNRQHALGWHNALLDHEAEAKKQAKDQPKKKKKKAAPEAESEFPTGEIEAAPMSQSAIDQYCNEVEARLENITFPTRSETGFSEHNGGHRYMSRSHDKNEQAKAHTEFCRNAGLGQIGISDPSHEQKTLWQHFKVVMGEEGDTSALNTWDAQIVTIGSGYGGKYEQANKVLNRLPAAYKDQLYQAGIWIGPEGQIRYLDTTEKKVYTERDAWKKIRDHHNLLGHFVNLAQSEQMIPKDENPDEEISMRNAMLKAQFEQFYANNLSLMKSKFASGPYNTRQMAIKMHHWLPGIFSWKAIKGMPTDFDAAFKWGEKTLKDAGKHGQLKQYRRMTRFKGVTSAKAAEKYANRQFNR